MMVRTLFSLLLLGLLSPAFAQVRVVKPVKTKPLTTKLGIGAGAAGSVLYLSRNVKENNEAYGYQLSLVYGGTHLFRGSFEYTSYQSMDIAPTWYDVKANSVELNLHIMARFSEGRAVIYPIFGISYNTFNGFYTGVRDFLNLGVLYPYNSNVQTKWWGFNAGTGYEHYFNRLSIFLDYKMRVGLSEGYNELNILDVCLSTGLRLNLIVPTPYGLFKGPRNRYRLKKVDTTN